MLGAVQQKRRAAARNSRRRSQAPSDENMILPVISTDGLAPPPADGTLTNRLAALSDLVLEIPSGGGGAEAVAGYKAFLAEFGCRVGPFDVLAEDKDAKVSLFSTSRTYVHTCSGCRCWCPLAFARLAQGVFACCHDTESS